MPNLMPDQPTIEAQFMNMSFNQELMYRQLLDQIRHLRNDLVADFNSKEVDQVIINALVATGDDTTRDISSLWFEATAEQDARDLVAMVDSRPILVDINWGNHT